MNTGVKNIRYIRQQGVALIMCLVMLVVFTILGLSTMSTSALEEQMASNSQSMMSSFQSADSAIAETMADDTVFTVAISNPAGADRNYAISKYPSTTKTMVAGAGKILEGSSINTFVGYPFDIAATATQAGTGAKTRLTQGVLFKAPNPN